MQTISIEVSDQNDLQLLLLLVKRLGLKIVKTPAPSKKGKESTLPGESSIKNGNADNVTVPDESKIEYHRSIIRAGTDMTEEKLQEILESLKEGRQRNIADFQKISGLTVVNPI